MSSSRTRPSGRHFPVGGQWRHVPVVDTGCGCRPRLPRQLLMSLPSFLRPSPKPRSGGSHSSSSSSFFPSSASTASFSSSSAATYTTTYSSSYSSSNCYSHVYKQDPPPHKMAKASSPAPAPVARKKRINKVKKRYEKMEEAEAEEDDVGLAVEKESSDPRADFRNSMLQMVVEMELCDWDDLRSMLRRLLALNAPRHHAAILTAFAEVCTQLVAPPAPPPPPPRAYHYHY